MARSLLSRLRCSRSAGRIGRAAGWALGAWLASSGVLLGCGGSSSESPWPIEPLEKDRGPRGEALPGAEASDLVSTGAPGSNGAGGGGSEEPSELEPMGGGSATEPK